MSLGGSGSRRGTRGFRSSGWEASCHPGNHAHDDWPCAASRSLGYIWAITEHGQKMIELVAGARRLGGEIAPVVGIDRPLQRDAADNLDAGACETFQLGRIVGEEPHARTSQHLQHAGGSAIVALVVVESQRGIGIQRIEPAILKSVSAHLVSEPEAAAFLLQVQNDSAALLI